MPKTLAASLAADALALSLLLACPVAAQTHGSSTASAQDVGADQWAADNAPIASDDKFALHAQTTFVAQGHSRFRSPYEGPNSLTAAPAIKETFDATIYAGAQLRQGAELWVDPEIDQGFGLNNTLGVAGFPNGEAYKVGKAHPYFKLPRAFLRQTIDLGGTRETVAADLNQFAGSHTTDRLVVTIGKLSVADVFDTNAYAHDPRGDFLNWTLLDAGTFDYAANAWGYTAGAAIEWYRGRWTARAGAFLLSDVPNSEHIDWGFAQNQLIGEIEERHSIGDRPGKVRVTGFVTRGRMAKLDATTALGTMAGQPVDPALVRHFASRPGVSVNLEQEITDDLHAFARAGWADGRYEAYEFTDVDRSLSGGLALSGNRWCRSRDTFGLAAVVNGASRARQRFLDAGGLGILVGDGGLPHPGGEWIVESYYKLAIAKSFHIAIDYQRVTSPGYNRDRGPVNVFAVRLHGQM
ncbi:carbohydrate porin [Sphingomonas paucimobilis]|uniref:carbohydrate porin n=1 Tax=Sphingomonas paucimobilis TaxID=13689 RepID=UPI0030F89AB0